MAETKNQKLCLACKNLLDSEANIFCNIDCLDKFKLMSLEDLDPSIYSAPIEKIKLNCLFCKDDIDTSDQIFCSTKCAYALVLTSDFDGKILCHYCFIRGKMENSHFCSKICKEEYEGIAEQKYPKEKTDEINLLDQLPTKQIEIDLIKQDESHKIVCYFCSKESVEKTNQRCSKCQRLCPVCKKYDVAGRSKDFCSRKCANEWGFIFR